MPGSGDSVQALKAGIMEIPDVIAVNKMDHPAAKTMLNEVRSIVALAEPETPAGDPPHRGAHGENVPELWAAIEEHRAALESDGRLEERRRKNLSARGVRRRVEPRECASRAAVAEDPELRASSRRSRAASSIR